MAILLVDDDSDLRDSLAELLSAEFGQSVLRAYDATTALYVLRTQPRPRVVILDVRLADGEALSSRALLEAMRSNDDLRDVPVITMSGAPLPEEFPSHIHIQKPFGVNALRRAFADAGVRFE